MIGEIIKYAIYLIIILIIFAFLPDGVLNKLKTFFNWDNFLNTLKTGLDRFLNFLQEITGIDFSNISFLEKIKILLSNFFEKLANILR